LSAYQGCRGKEAIKWGIQMISGQSESGQCNTLAISGQSKSGQSNPGQSKSG